jgi:hypothetical protein
MFAGSTVSTLISSYVLLSLRASHGYRRGRLHLHPHIFLKGLQLNPHVFHEGWAGGVNVPPCSQCHKFESGHTSVCAQESGHITDDVFEIV